MSIFANEQEDAFSPVPSKNDTTALMIKSVSLVIIICAGTVENATVIYTIIKDRKLHRAPYYYMINLAVADLMRSILCLPFVLATTMHGSIWRYGPSGCKLMAFTTTFFTFGALFALFILALDRHMSIVHLKFHSRRFKGLMCLVMVLAGWAVAFLLAFPPVFGLGTYQFIPVEGQCSFEHRYYTNNDTLGFTMIFIGMVALTIFAYVRIFFFLRAHRKMRPIIYEPARSHNWAFYGPGANAVQQQGNNNVPGLARAPTNPLNIGIPHNRPFITARYMQPVSPKNERLTRLFVMATIVFDILWLPYMMMCLWIMFSEKREVNLVFATVSTWLTYSQVTALPLVYFLAHPPFRQSLSRSVSTSSSLDGYVLRDFQ